MAEKVKGLLLGSHRDRHVFLIGVLEGLEGVGGDSGGQARSWLGCWSRLELWVRDGAVAGGSWAGGLSSLVGAWHTLGGGTEWLGMRAWAGWLASQALGAVGGACSCRGPGCSLSGGLLWCVRLDLQGWWRRTATAPGLGTALGLGHGEGRGLCRCAQGWGRGNRWGQKRILSQEMEIVSSDWEGLGVGGGMEGGRCRIGRQLAVP